MALRKNPVTGMLEEDGLPGGELDPAAMPVVPTTFNADPAGALPAGGLSVQVGPATKPLQEVETARKIRTPETVQADAALEAAQAETDKAQGKVTEIGGQEADIGWEAQQGRVDTRRAMMDQTRSDEDDRRRRVDAAMSDDARMIDEEKKARLAAGNAPQSFWEGRPAAQFFTKVLQVIGGAAHDASGQGGPSPADRVLAENIENHRRKLVTAWEASKEANALKRTNRQAFDAELERRSIWANNQSLAQLDLLEEEMKAGLAGLSKEKQAAADQLATAKLNEQRAQLRQQNAQGYDRLQKITDNSYGPGSGPAGKVTQGQGEAAGGFRDILMNVDKASQVKVDKEHLQTFRNNSERLRAHDVNVGQGEEVLPALKRATGWTPEGAYDGIPEEAKAAIEAQIKAFDAINKVMTGAAQSDSEFARRAPQWLLQPGDSQADVNRKLLSMIDFARARSVQAGPAMTEVLQLADVVQGRVQQRSEARSLKPTQAAPAAPKAPSGKPFDANDPKTWNDDQLAKARSKLEAQAERGKKDPRYRDIISEIGSRRRKAN